MRPSGKVCTFSLLGFIFPCLEKETSLKFFTADFLKFMQNISIGFLSAGHLLCSLVVDIPASMSLGQTIRNFGTEMTLARHS